jgi:hypothetical protein
MSRNLGALTLLDPSGPAWPLMGVLYLLLTYVYMYSYDNTSLSSAWMRNASDKVVKEIKTHSLCSVHFFSESHTFNELMEEKSP